MKLGSSSSPRGIAGWTEPIVLIINHVSFDRPAFCATALYPLAVIGRAILRPGARSGHHSGGERGEAWDRADPAGQMHAGVPDGATLIFS